MSSLYFCRHDNNTCPRKDACKRYIQQDDECVVSMFYEACTEKNNYVLFMKLEGEDNNDVQ